MKTKSGWVMLLFIASTSYASSAFDAVKAVLEDRANSFLVRGAAVAVIEDGKSEQILYGDAKTERDLFQIGSISKSFTGIAITKLSLEKRIDLEAPISHYIPELTGTFVGSATADQLGLHMARLVHDYVDSAGNASGIFTEAELITFLKAYQPDPVAFPAGKRQYSNLGFETLGLLLSRIEGKSFRSVIDDEILKPLSMKDTGFGGSATSPRGLLPGLDVLLNPAPYEGFSDLGDAAGGIYSDLYDMKIYMKANLHPGHSSLGSAIQLSQALGVGWDSDPGTLPVWKNGGVSGFVSWFSFDPSQGTGFIFMENNEDLLVAYDLSNVAQGKSEIYKDVPLDPGLISEVAGSYKSSDQKIGLVIQAFHEKFLSATSTTSDGSGDARLFFISSKNGKTVFGVNDGIDFNDALEVQEDPVTQIPQLTYLQCTGVDSTGKPIIQSIPLQRTDLSEKDL